MLYVLAGLAIALIITLICAHWANKTITYIEKTTKDLDTRLDRLLLLTKDVEAEVNKMVKTLSEQEEDAGK
jgi:ribosomal protein L7Ae-like RNA K-turn-binding protein